MDRASFRQGIARNPAAAVTFAMLVIGILGYAMFMALPDGFPKLPVCGLAELATALLATRIVRACEKAEGRP